jgi:hypothetical protein
MVEVCWEMEMFQKRPKVVEKKTTWVTEEMPKQKSPNRKASKTIVVGVTAIFTFGYVIYTIFVYNN